MAKKETAFEIINLIFLIMSVVIPLIFFILTSPAEIKTQTYIIFGIIALVLIAGGFVTYVVSKWTSMMRDVKTAKTDIEEIKKDLIFKDLWNKMDIRLNVLENLFFNKKNKKAQTIDPRIIIWIILLILLYLFLKSIGFFG